MSAMQSTGRHCPGPIIGAFISDMIPKFMQGLVDSRVGDTAREFEVFSTLSHLARDRAEVLALAVRDTASSPPGNAAKLSRGVHPECVGATVDPFQTLPIELRGVSAQRIFHHCGLTT